MNNSSKEHPFIDITINVMRGNHEYLSTKNILLYGEIVQLLRDIIQYSQNAVNKLATTDMYAKSAINYFLFNILNPYGNALYVDILTGNIPASFMELRLIIEGLADSFLADKKYPEGKDFDEKLTKLRAERKIDERGNPRDISAFQRMEELETAIGKEGIAKQFSKISHHWSHSRGVMDRLIKGMSSLSVPSWGLTMPCYYSDDDKPDLDQLALEISFFREILSLTVKA